MRIRAWALPAILLAAVVLTSIAAHAQAPAWPTRPVRFIVPFGPGAAADIGARLFADKLSARWGQPVVIENRPGGDSIIAITSFLSSNDDHILLYMPSGNFTAHQYVHSKLPYDPDDLSPIVRTSNTVMVVALGKDSPYNTLREFTEAARASPGKFNSGLVPGVTEFTFWAYTHHEKLNIQQVPYRDINLSPTDLAEDRIQVVMASLAIVQPQLRADRIKLITLANKERTSLVPGVPTAIEQGFPSLTFDGLHGLIGLKSMPKALKEKIAADFREAAADGTIAARMAASGSVINIGGPDEFSAAIAEQRAAVGATAKAVNFKPRN